MSDAPKSLALLVFKGLLCGLVYVAATIFTNIAAAALHLQLPDLSPHGVSQAAAVRAFAVASALMGVALTPLAAGLRGKRLPRWLALAFLPFICMYVNAVIEILMFTTMLQRHQTLPFIASGILPALFFGGALAFIAKRELHAPDFSRQLTDFFSTHSAPSYVWRLLLAILAFPAAYLIFGMIVAPFVVPAYRAGIAGLILPPLSTIMPMQFLRSALFLLASLPSLILWKGQRSSLIVSLGLAHWFFVGLFGLLQPGILPPALRLAHSLEIGADSFAYAAAIVLLLAPRLPATAPATHSAAPVFLS